MKSFTPQTLVVWVLSNGRRVSFDFEDPWVLWVVCGETESFTKTVILHFGRRITGH